MKKILLLQIKINIPLEFYTVEFISCRHPLEVSLGTVWAVYHLNAS